MLYAGLSSKTRSDSFLLPVPFIPDGKLLVAGEAQDQNGDTFFGLARYNSNGTLDATFGTGGKVTSMFVANGGIGDITRQADGKFVVVGSAGGNFAIARYNADGSPDTTFDGDGQVTTDFAGGFDIAHAVTVQADGKIVVAGQADLSGNRDFALARYETNGMLDMTFDGDGKVTTDFDVSLDNARAVTINSDGKIVAAGSAFLSTFNTDFALARYNSDGSLDNSFDGDGKVTTDFGGGPFTTDEARSVIIQPDGKILAGGLATFEVSTPTFTGTQSNFALARYNTNGSLDMSFDGDGKATTTFGPANASAIEDLALLGDGRIVAGGSANMGGTGNDFALARYNTNGGLDLTFDFDGKVTTDFLGGDNSAQDVKIQPDGKIVVVGINNDQAFALARYNPNGSLDSVFASSEGGILMLTTRAFMSLLLTIACLVATANPQLTAAQTAKDASVAAIPDTAAGRHLTGWLKAINSGDPKLIRAFHVGSGAVERVDRRAQQDAQFYGQTRGLELRKIEQSTDNEIVVLVQAKLTEAWFRVSIKAASEPPRGVETMSVRRTSNPAPQKVSEAEMLKAIDVYIKKLVAADVFSGAVLVAKNGKSIFTGAYGFASIAYKAPNRLDTKFNLGSMNKMFTAVAVCQLAEQGKLAFTDPIGRHLTDYANKAAAEKVTIEHLLTHSSGIGDYFNEKFMEASRDRFRKIKDYFPLFVDKPLEFEPGSKFRYSNAGFMVLGAIVEKVSGQDYFDYVREHIYKPAGMINSDAYELDRDTPNLAVGYTNDGDRSGPENSSRRNNVFMHVIKGGPAGGGYSTVEDLLRFDIALRQHKLLSAKHTDLVLAGKIASGFSPDAKYAYGFFDERINGKRIVGHGGGFPGINSQLDMYLDNGYTVAVMSNYDPPAAQIVASKLREMILQL